MKKKAFTLIELLAVIIILAIIMVIAVPQVLNMIEKTRENAYKLSAELMRKSAETYIASGRKEIGVDGTVVTLDELVSNGFIKPIKDVKDKSTECIGYVLVEIENGKAIYTPSLKCGENYVSEDYDPVLAGEEEPIPVNANIHQSSVPNGYTGIYKIEDLNNIRNNLSGLYILMNDLDFNNDNSYTTPTNKVAYITGSGWNPIGNNTNKFVGTFNGNNYVIKNLYINRSSTDYVGLFGYTDITSTLIEKVGLEGVNVTGKQFVGGLVGYNRGTVRNTYTTGTITGLDVRTGGLVGYNYGASGATAKIENSYSSANVNGTNYVGGLAGSSDNYSSVTNSYGAGNVNATTGVGGGILGYLNSVSGSITNSYRNSDATISAVTTNIEGISEKKLILQYPLFTKYALGWDTENIWYVINWQYPKLGGIKEPIDYKLDVTKIEDLYLIRYNLSGNYNLMNDLDFNNSSDYRNSELMGGFTTGEGWDPVGNSTNKFSGTFNGNNYVIKNLYINRPDTDNVGLFGYTNTATSIIEKVGLEGVNVAGKQSVGGLVGYSKGIVRNTYTTGTIVGTSQYVGGLVGYNYGASGTPAKVENSYSTANVSGTTYVGGLIGCSSNYSNVTNSYGAGNVNATTGVGGGILGYLNSVSGSITNSYRNSDATISAVTTNIEGISERKLILQYQPFVKYVLTWDTENIWDIVNWQYPKFGSIQETIDYVYNISKIEDLYLIRYNLSGNYNLMNDLDFNNSSNYRKPELMDGFTTGDGWDPVGNSTNKFSGTFNGNNYVIKNLYINRPDTDNVGLFGYTNTATSIIEKVGLEGVNVAGKQSVGGLVGYSKGIVRNTYTTGTIVGTSQYVGGLVGYNYGASGTPAKVENSYSTANVSGTTYVGGLIGYSSNYSNVTNSYGAGNVNATTGVGGGILGYLNSISGTITNSYRNSDATLSAVTLDTNGNLATSTELKSLSRTGLTTWDTSTIWKVNAGAYPTFK